VSEDRIFAKCAWRLMPLLLAAYIANYIDRSNVGFAALTMNRELGFSQGFGAVLCQLRYSILVRGPFHPTGIRFLHDAKFRAWGPADFLSWVPP